VNQFGKNPSAVPPEALAPNAGNPFWQARKRMARAVVFAIIFARNQTFFVALSNFVQIAAAPRGRRERMQGRAILRIPDDCQTKKRSKSGHFGCNRKFTFYPLRIHMVALSYHQSKDKDRQTPNITSHPIPIKSLRECGGF